MKPIMTSASFTEFGGSGNQELPRRTPEVGDAQQMGQIEGAPHGVPHVWTTEPTLDRNKPPMPNMGALASAAFDPGVLRPSRQHRPAVGRLGSGVRATPIRTTRGG
jgi:hypothetical protein